MTKESRIATASCSPRPWR